MIPVVVYLMRAFRSEQLRRAALQRNIQIVRPFDWANMNNVILSRDSFIGPGSNFWGKGKVILGANVIIGPNLTIMTSNHDYRSEAFLPYGYEDLVGDVVIEDNVWIGANVSIVPGVKIGEGCVIGMGSVVTKSLDRLTVVGGNPAKQIGIRNHDTYEKLKAEAKFYMADKAKRTRGRHG